MTTHCPWRGPQRSEDVGSPQTGVWLAQFSSEVQQDFVAVNKLILKFMSERKEIGEQEGVGKEAESGLAESPCFRCQDCMILCRETAHPGAGRPSTRVPQGSPQCSVWGWLDIHRRRSDLRPKLDTVHTNEFKMGQRSKFIQNVKLTKFEKKPRKIFVSRVRPGCLRPETKGTVHKTATWTPGSIRFRSVGFHDRNGGMGPLPRGITLTGESY